MFKHVVADKRLWVLGSCMITVSILARWVFTPDQVFPFVAHSGYWLMLGLTLLFGHALWRSGVFEAVRAGWGRFEAAVLAGILLICVVWAVHERPGYKVLADELLLVGTSMGMHYEREATYPTRATDIQGVYRVLSGTLDKRPLLFPFLVTVVHDATGYRPENAFYLNMGLGVIFLAMVYALGRQVTGERWGGVLAVLLFGGLPLLAQQSTGGGFELLNLTLIAALALLMARYLEAPDVWRLEAMVWCGLMLACTRYESGLFLLPVAVAAVLGWHRRSAVLASWTLLFAAPVWFLVLAQNRVFSGSSSAWEMQSVAGVSEPFGLQYLGNNLGHALAFFFELDGFQPNSVVFAALGLVAVPFLMLWLMGALRTLGRAEGRMQAWALMSCALLAVTSVYLLYFWGQFDEPIIRRLSLPVHLLFLFAVLLAGSQWLKSPRGWVAGCWLAGLAFLVQGLPTLARQGYRTSYSPGVEMEFRAAFLERFAERNLLFIDNDSFFWITRRIASSPVAQSKERKESLIYHLRNRSFSDMYVFQSYLVDDATGEQRVAPEDDLGPDFELETVWERRIQTLLFARISRVKAIREGGEVAASAVPFVTPAQEARTAEQLDENRSAYLETWIKQLP